MANRGRFGQNPPVTDDRADRATLASIALATAAQAAFFAFDERIPRDPMMTGTKLIDAWERLGEAPGAALIAAAVDRAGWYHLAVAGLLRIHRAPWVLEGVFLGWLLVILAATAAIGRTTGGPRAGLAATWLAIGLPPVLLFTRQSWVHVPEAGLGLALAAIVLGDPALRRLRTVAAAAAIGLLMIRLRPSGLIQLVAIGAALAVARDGWRRVGLVAATWTAASVWTAATMGPYLSAKGPPGLFHERPLGWLVEQVPQTTGWLGGCALAIAAAAAAIHRPRPERPALAWLVAAGSLPLLLMMRYRSGSHDFTFWGPTLAVAGALSLSRTPAGLAVAAAAALVALVAPFVPGGVGARLRDALGPHDLPAPLDLRSPRVDWGAEIVHEALDAACLGPGKGSCHILAPSGLFYPLRNEDLGNLELFLMAEDRVQLRALGDAPPRGFAAWRVDAMAVWDCGAEDAWGYDKHPDLGLRTVEAAQQLGLSPAVSVDVGPCTWHWLVSPRGAAHPEALPSGGGRAWDPAGIARRNQAWLDEHPDQRGRTLLPRASRLRGEAL